MKTELEKFEYFWECIDYALERTYPSRYIEISRNAKLLLEKKVKKEVIQDYWDRIYSSEYWKNMSGMNHRFLIQCRIDMEKKHLGDNDGI